LIIFDRLSRILVYPWDVDIPGGIGSSGLHKCDVIMMMLKANASN